MGYPRKKICKRIEFELIAYFGIFSDSVDKRKAIANNLADKLEKIWEETKEHPTEADAPA